ncbi:hypothetical protein RFI_39992 [Reticulomyxa filosa]|uniref:Uncharacterized protein n=1 Tax=Reticulomyxa filosa TaxID=46433 RepID=X6L7W4_RETFI|nr:hypothetical protein RFI_39992 [Reticulomyxa filosa]|eukprot:ETN97535.1 hypothetical protein RFI_39992 [Reticulomyxa filosa]
MHALKPLKKEITCHLTLKQKEVQNHYLEIQCSDIYFPICVVLILCRLLCRNSTNVQQQSVSKLSSNVVFFIQQTIKNDFILSYSSNKKPCYKTKNNFFDKKCDSHNMVMLCMFISFMYAIIGKIFSKFKKQQTVLLSVLKGQQKSPFSLKNVRNKIQHSIQFFKFPNLRRRSIFKKLIGGEYLRMAREATIDKENLDYLNHYKMFYICDITDNLQHWMIVEKESFIVCCENGGLPLHNTLSSLQFSKLHVTTSPQFNTLLWYDSHPMQKIFWKFPENLKIITLSFIDAEQQTSHFLEKRYAQQGKSFRTWSDVRKLKYVRPPLLRLLGLAATPSKILVKGFTAVTMSKKQLKKLEKH